MDRRRVGVLGVGGLAVLSLLGTGGLAGCSTPAPPAESVYYTITGTATEAIEVSNTNASGGTDAPGTVTLPYTSQTYQIKPQGAAGHYLYEFSASGIFGNTAGAWTVTITVYGNGSVEGQQSDSGNDNSIPVYVTASWQ